MRGERFVFADAAAQLFGERGKSFSFIYVLPFLSLYLAVGVLFQHIFAYLLPVGIIDQAHGKTKFFYQLFGVGCLTYRVAEMAVGIYHYGYFVLLAYLERFGAAFQRAFLLKIEFSFISTNLPYFESFKAFFHIEWVKRGRAVTYNVYRGFLAAARYAFVWV